MFDPDDDDNGSRLPPPPPSLRSGRRPAKNMTKARRYRALRLASGPTTGQFGIRTHVDERGREYHVIPKTGRKELACRIVAPLRDTAASTATTTGPADSVGGQQRWLSRTGGPWRPTWPGIDLDLVLFRIRDQVLERGVVDQVWAMPRSTTARVILKDPLYAETGPVSDPGPYLHWIPQARRRKGASQISRGFISTAGEEVRGTGGGERGGFPAVSDESL